MKSVLKKLFKLIFFRPLGMSIGRNSWVVPPRWIRNPKRVYIGNDSFIGRFATLHPQTRYGGQSCDGQIILGDGVYIGGFAQIHSMGRLEIGDGSVLSEHVYISDIAHGLNPLGGSIMKQPLESKGAVRIGRNVFIGFGSSVLPGVTLGDHCVVGTRSVVTRSFPPYSMVAGSPARLIKRFDLERQEWVKPNEHESEHETA